MQRTETNRTDDSENSQTAAAQRGLTQASRCGAQPQRPSDSTQSAARGERRPSVGRHEVSKACHPLLRVTRRRVTTRGHAPSQCASRAIQQRSHSPRVTSLQCRTHQRPQCNGRRGQQHRRRAALPCSAYGTFCAPCTYRHTRQQLRERTREAP